MRSSFAMTEPAPGGGSDPSMIKTYAEKHGDTWKIYGRKWFITGAAAASHFILAARTSDDKRKGITTFLYHKDQPGWKIVRRIEIMGPEEHGGHCELEFDGLEVHDDDVFGGLGNGLKVVQVRLGPARLTHCMRWTGWAKRCMEIAQEYVNRREGFGVKLADRESVQMKLGEVGHNIQIGRLLTMHAAWKLDQGDFARKEVSMAKVHMANTLHQAADVAIQLQGARGYSKDTIVRMGLSRRPRRAPGRRRRRGAQDGAGEVHARGRPRLLELERGQPGVSVRSSPLARLLPTALTLPRTSCRACCFGAASPAASSTRCSGRMMQVQTSPSGLNSSLPSPSALTVTRSSTKQPKPFWLGAVTGGPPLSRQVRRRSRSPGAPASRAQSMLTLPAGADSAPYFDALVASSCSASATFCTASALSRMRLAAAVHLFHAEGGELRPHQVVD